jgi:hypothetical protein
MLKHKLIEIPATNVRSLAWDESTLIDWMSGPALYRLDGKCESPKIGIRYAYGFDAVANSPSGTYQVIYTRLGTKGLVLRRGELVREINRSYYFADAYEYPIALFTLKDGREVLAHCPDKYCRLEIEDLESGARLTESEGRSPDDFFHSRLAASPSGRYLLSAGWVWHPIDVTQVFDVETALTDATHLDGEGLPLNVHGDESSAAFLSDNRLAVAVDRELDEDNTPGSSADRELKIFDLEGGTALATIHPQQKVGTMMAVGEEYLLSLYEHPKLIHLGSNEVVGSWPHINSGIQTSSILMDENRIPPPIALDPRNHRCAIAGSDRIHVLQFDE